MYLSDELLKVNTLLIDTAPIIYYIEAHFRYGPLLKDVVGSLEKERIKVYSSVITLTEVISKPIEKGDKKLAKEFTDFLKHGKNLKLTDITVNIAEYAGMLRGKYPDLKTIDAIQLSSAIDIGADAFLTNDKRLKKIKEIRVLVLEDYL